MKTLFTLSAALLLTACAQTNVASPTLAIAPIEKQQINAKSPCVVGGCSGQLCTHKKDGPAISTCEWKQAYSCYQKAGVCEVQANGTCGWSQTRALDLCLTEAKIYRP